MNSRSYQNSLWVIFISINLMQNACSLITADQIDEFEVQAGEMQFNEAETDQMQAGDIQAGDMQVGDMQVGDMQASDMQAGDMQAGDMQAGDMQAGDMQAGDMQAGDMQAGDMQMQDLTNHESNWCKLISSSTMTNILNVSNSYTETCSWIDLTQSCETDHSSVITVTDYNEYGAPLRISTTSNHSTITQMMYYDCSLGWCKLLNQVSIGEESSQTDCTWDNLTQTCNTEMISTSTTTYNEYGRILQFFLSNHSSDSITEYTYDCSGRWCKQLTMNVISMIDNNTTMFSTTCEWADLHQTCYNDDPNYIETKIYNEQGDVLRSTISTTNYQMNTLMVYDCP
ncbi:MAG: hypothetical protein CMH49_07210 [Myxococcales bacterium]|nr:hypothetical protein [Myxococcales bacterium]